MFSKNLRQYFWLVVLGFGLSHGTAQDTNSAKLDFPLPKAAKYTVTDKQFADARALLKTNFTADTNKLNTIISHPSVCGPGLWHLLKDSPHFAVPPIAKTTARVPVAGGRVQEFPAAMFQNADEAARFKAALADLLAKNGDLKFRLPTEKEFKLFWALIPFDDLSDPLIVAEGTRYDIIISFGKGKPFWFDELRNVYVEK